MNRLDTLITIVDDFLSKGYLMGGMEIFLPIYKGVYFNFAHKESDCMIKKTNYTILGTLKDEILNIIDS